MGTWSYLNSPLGELAGVVPQLVGEHGSALRVELLPPLHSVSYLRVPLVQRLDSQELRLALRALHHCVVLATGYQNLRSYSNVTSTLSKPGKLLKCYLYASRSDSLMYKYKSWLIKLNLFFVYIKNWFFLIRIKVSAQCCVTYTLHFDWCGRELFFRTLDISRYDSIRSLVCAKTSTYNSSLGF